MAKTIKFDLPIDGVKVSTLDELRDHFTAEVVGHFRSGLLAKWLRSCRMTEQLDAVEALTTNEDSTVLQGLCDIFAVEADADAISAAIAVPAGVSIDDLAGALQVPAIVLLTYLEPPDSTDRSTDSIISNKEMIELLRHMIFPALRSLRTIALDEESEGKIANEGECEVWVLVNPLYGRLVIQIHGELHTQVCLLDRSGDLVAEDADGGGGRNFEMVCELNSGLYFALVRGHGGATGKYSLHVHHISGESTTKRSATRQVDTYLDGLLVREDEEVERTFHPHLLPLSAQLGVLALRAYLGIPSIRIPSIREKAECTFYPLLLPLSAQIAELAKFREGNDE